MGMEMKKALQIGQMLKDERYRVDEILDHNGITVTYKAYDTFREKKVVIKELFPDSIVERNRDDNVTVFCKNLIHEQNFIMLKEHMIKKAKKMIQLYPIRNIANIIAFFEENETVYLVSEYIEGVSIEDYLIKKLHMEKIRMQEALKILQPTIEALLFLHSKGLVHGKISPKAIYVVDGRSVLCDFGDPMEDAAKSFLIEATARVPEFAAVEQYMENAVPTVASDVYALAAVIYYLVTGEHVPPFYERIDQENPDKKDPFIPAIEQNQTLMKFQSDALTKALTIYEKDRYGSVEGFVEDISAEEFNDAPEVVPRQVIRESFLARHRYYRVIGGIAVACILFLCIFFGPKVVDYVHGLEAKEFYTNLMTDDVYEKCVSVANLSEKKREIFANDYEKLDALSANEVKEIHYYDAVKKRLCVREQLSLNGSVVKYVTLDYRKGTKAILTIADNGEITTYEIVLNPDAEGRYMVSTIHYGKEGNSTSKDFVGPKN